jgi:hypothetical protein
VGGEVQNCGSFTPCHESLKKVKSSEACNAENDSPSRRFMYSQRGNKRSEVGFPFPLPEIGNELFSYDL